MTGGNAITRALDSLDPCTWHTLVDVLVVGDRIPVTMHQWNNIIADAGLITSIDRVWAAIGRVRRASAESGQAVGRTLRPAVLGLIEEAGALRAAAADVLWFEPPEGGGPAAVQRCVGELCSDVVGLLNVLTSEGTLPLERRTRPAVSPEDFGVVDSAGDEDDDRAYRVYGVPGHELPSLGSPVATRLRSAFLHRLDDLNEITARIVGYATNGRVPVEQIDGAVHAWALATDARPLAAHRAARAACDLVLRRAADDLHATAAAISEGFRFEQDAYSSHRAHSRARRALTDAEDPDEETRIIADMYRIVTEGPLRQAAAATLRILGRPATATAGLNDIKGRLRAQTYDTPLCAMIDALIVPAWRNPSAHEHIHWDPDAGTAMLGGKPVDIDNVFRMGELAWATARGFQAGVTIGRACSPRLGQAIDALDQHLVPVRRDFRLIQFLDQSVLDLDVYDVLREPMKVTIALDPVRGTDRLRRIGAALVELAQIEPEVQWWGIEFAEQCPPFVIGSTAARLATGLYGRIPGSGRRRAFIYPPAFVPLLADALVALGLPTVEAAAVAWDLPLRDTLTATAQLANGRGSYRPDACAHEYAAVRRTNSAVRVVAQHLGLHPPADLDLSYMLSLLRQIEQQPRNVVIRGLLAGEQHRLRTVLGPTRSHPWSELATDSAPE